MHCSHCMKKIRWGLFLYVSYYWPFNDQQGSLVYEVEMFVYHLGFTLNGGVYIFFVVSKEKTALHERTWKRVAPSSLHGPNVCGHLCYLLLKTKCTPKNKKIIKKVHSIIQQSAFPMYLKAIKDKYCYVTNVAALSKTQGVRGIKVYSSWPYTLTPTSKPIGICKE